MIVKIVLDQADTFLVLVEWQTQGLTKNEGDSFLTGCFVDKYRVWGVDNKAYGTYC